MTIHNLVQTSAIGKNARNDLVIFLSKRTFIEITLVAVSVGFSPAYTISIKELPVKPDV
jgi:hypothetical protein